MSGIVGNNWTLDDRGLIEEISSGTYLTAYSSGMEDFLKNHSLSCKVDLGGQFATHWEGFQAG